MEEVRTPSTTNTGLFQQNGLSVTAEYNGIFGSYQQHWHDASVSSAGKIKITNVDHRNLQNSNSNSNHHNHCGGEDSLLDRLQECSKDNSFSPPVSPHDNGSSSICLTTSDHMSASDNDIDEPARKKRNPVPDNKKDDRYWERRKKNNQAAKRSREMKRKKVEDELVRAKDAITENQKLKQEIEVLKAEINSLRRLLKDANMTLSLWIRARQASEPPSQLPPMLRNPGNMPFVTFPVSSSGLQ